MGEKMVFTITPEQQEKMDEIIANYADTEGALIPVLHEVQEVIGYLPMEVQKYLSEKMNIPLAEIYGVITFYTQFSLNPKGEYKIGVCLGTACYVKGSGDILEKIKEIIKVEVGECSDDGKFSLEATRCIGACGPAPVMTINDEVYGRLVVDDIPGILEKY